MAISAISEGAEAEDIFGSSLQLLYGYAPVTFWGSIFVHKRSGCTLESPKPESANWGLHAASIWIASLFFADHIHEVVEGCRRKLEGSRSVHTMRTTSARMETLELGAGSGMAGIVLAKELRSHFGDAVSWRVTLSDYPDPSIMACLHQNIVRNNVPVTNTRVVGHVWGDRGSIIAGLGLNSFDTIIAADTLWNPELHMPFCQTLQMTLKKSLDARIYVVAGLHTGRWTIQSFMQKLTQFAFLLESITERFVGANSFGVSDDQQTALSHDRDWAVERLGESEADTRQWVIWMVVKWDPAKLDRINGQTTSSI